MVIYDGQPYRDIHPYTKEAAQVSPVMFVSGIASGYRVNWSTMVRQFLKSEDGVSGPTISRWTCENLDELKGNWEREADVRRVTLQRWQ